MISRSDSDSRVPEKLTFTRILGGSRWDCNEMPSVWCTKTIHSHEEPYEELIVLNWLDKEFHFLAISETRKINENPEGHLVLGGKIKKPDDSWPRGYWESEVIWHMFMPSGLQGRGYVGDGAAAFEIVKKFLCQCPTEHPDIPFTVIDVTLSNSLEEAMDRRVF